MIIYQNKRDKFNKKKRKIKIIFQLIIYNLYIKYFYITFHNFMWFMMA
jgi:hypothetical protein